MADDDKQGPPDGYGLGLTRRSEGFGFLSGELRGRVTFQIAAALGLTEAITIAASHKATKRTVALGMTEDIEIAASSTTTYAFNVDFLGPFGSPTTGGAISYTARYTASPTGQTHAHVLVHVSGNYTAEEGAPTEAVVTNIRWDPRDLSGTGWSLTVDWTPGGAVGEWYSVIDKSPITTGATIAPILCDLQASFIPPGTNLLIENQYLGTRSATDQAVSPLNPIVISTV